MKNLQLSKEVDKFLNQLNQNKMKEIIDTICLVTFLPIK